MKTFFLGGVLNNGHAANTQKNNEKYHKAAGNGGIVFLGGCTNAVRRDDVYIVSTNVMGKWQPLFEIV